MTANAHEHLDTLTLDQYCAAIGAATLLKSVVVFEQMAPEYVDAIARGLESGDKDQVLSEAHKLKGAAGSVGLKRIQELSQALQCGDEPRWQGEHRQWFEAIRDHLDADLNSLKHYLTERA
ncbi:Hpt domain-containing protein [Ferrimonas balearica]|uniref:Hpt domain-containing protein n=1 Tax=Ferrimonas balearica TaxID=44012 RepID=UPI001C9A22F0|nr:Hpt domain-containing protein [Ferrimonas balearica]MBY5922933.1 Hpt domain-containing protein [Ferrimonas balearica]MBY5997690.1 Hpt domain-containing protein [Ferrimonas balearica]